MIDARAEFLQRLHELLPPLQLPTDSYIICGSGPLAIRNIRPASDIDILVNKSLWSSLCEKFEPTGKCKNLIRYGNCEIWKDWMILSDKVDEMIKNRDLIDGYPFMKLCYVVTTKEYMGRKKDLIDLESIHKFLAASHEPV